MKIKSFLVLLALFYSVFSFAANKPFITTLDGQNLYGTDLKGRWLILHYWASWCDICMGEMPELQKFYQQLPKQKAQFYMVNYDHLNKSQVQKILSSMGVSIPSLIGNPGRLFGVRGASALPMTIIVNPEGKVLDVAYGPTNAKALNKIIQ